MTLTKNHQLNFLIDELFNQSPLKFKEAKISSYVPANILELDNSYELIISAPGRQKENFSLEINNGILVVAYTPNQSLNEQKTTELKFVRREFGVQAFKRTFTLDDKIDTEIISARYENGLLSIQLPKKENLKAGSKQIAIL